MADYSSISQILMRTLVKLKIDLESDQVPASDLIRILKRVDAAYEEFRTRISTLESAVRISSNEISDYLDKLKEADSLNRQRTQDIINLLDNIHLGILTINRDGRVHKEYSRYLEDILDTKDIANQAAIPLVFGQGDVNPDKISHMESVIDFALGGDLIGFELNERSLVRSFQITDKSGRSKALEIDWNPIINGEGQVDKIVMSLRDVTEIQVLRQQAKQNKIKLEILGQIVDVSIKTFQKFSQSMHGYLKLNRELMQSRPLDVVALNRNLHTIKGNARILSFDKIADCIHEAEHSIKNAVGLSETDFVQVVNSQLSKAEGVIAEYDEVADSQFHHGENLGEDLSELMICIREQMKDWESGRDSQAVCRKIYQAFSRLGTTTLSEALEELIAGLPSLAAELGKAPVLLDVSDEGLRLKSEAARTMADILGHAVRNAMDHGIEAPAERIAKGKAAEGRIIIRLYQEHDHLMLVVLDDGRGLNLEAIEKKARQLGVLKQPNCSPQDIANTIFLQDFSTAQAVNQISGRGIGMDAMRGLAHNLGAPVSLHLLNEQQRVAVPFKLIFQFPLSVAISSQDHTAKAFDKAS